MVGFLTNRKSRYLSERLKKIVEGTLDPRDWQALCLGDVLAPDVIYLPIPKAANTSIRTALKPCFGLGGIDVMNIHQDDRLDKRSMKEALGASKKNAFVFTVVRHPAERIYSTFKNKLGWFEGRNRFKLKRRFGHATNIGIGRGASFETFLEGLCMCPDWALDSHFKPQVGLLDYALSDPRLQVFKTEMIAESWPDIALDIKRASGVAPDAVLGVLNRSKKPTHPFSSAERRMIDLLYEKDFERFGYNW